MENLSTILLKENLMGSLEQQNSTSVEFDSTIKNVIVNWSPGLILMTVLPFGIFQTTSARNKDSRVKIFGHLQLILSLVIVFLTTSCTMNAIKEMLYDDPIPTFFILSPSIVKSLDFITSGRITSVLFGLYLTLAITKLIQKFYGHNTNQSLQKTDTNKQDLESSASVFSRLTFSWCTKLFVKGYKGKLEMDDRFPLCEDDSTFKIVKRFEKYWNQEAQTIQKDKAVTECETTGNVDTKNTQPNLAKCLMKAFGTYLLMAATLQMVSAILGLCTPLVLRLLIQFTEDTTELQWKGYMYAAIMFGLAVSRTLCDQQLGHNNCKMERRLWTSITSLIYKKTLKLSNAEKKSCTSGEIVNLMSVDASRISSCVHDINQIWAIPFMFCSTLYLLWQTIGASAFIGMGIIVLIVPFNSKLVKKSRDLQLKSMDLKDSRVKMMNEVLNSIKVLKLYGWEHSFEKQINEVREKELEVIQSQGLVGATMFLVWIFTPFAVSLGTFAMFVLIDDANVLTAETAFVAMSLFGMLNWNLIILPHIVNHYVQANVALKRIQSFLKKDELNEQVVTKNKDTKYAVSVENGTFSWNKDKTPTLTDINIQIPEGSFVAIVGSIGSGKSSLISAILGEMEPVSGNLNIKGSVAYVSQQAWIRNTTLEKNILFGKEMNRREYDNIMNATTLRVDLDMLSGGDQTEIGEKGINLSGGQKQRVSLARAVYQNADVYLLDDPLSAVDAHVGKNIFDNVLDKNGKIGNKTRILVTNAVSFLPKTDMIIVMADGKVSEVGSFDELINHKGAFAEFLNNYMLNQTTYENKPPHSKEEEIFDPIIERSTKEKDVGENVNGNHNEEKTKTQIIDEESNECKKTRLEVYTFYLRTIGLPTSFVLVFLNIIFELLVRCSDVWITDWTNDHSTYVNRTVATDKRNMRLAVFAGIGVVQGLIFLAYAPAVAFARTKASRNLHQQLLRNVLRSPMTFFDSTPIGRIVNRFSKDVSKIDSDFIYLMKDSIIHASLVIINSSIICIGTPKFVFVIFPVAIVYFLLQRLFTKSSTQLTRFQTATNSPIFSQFSETISGTTTIRAYNQQDRFIAEAAEKADDDKRSIYAVQCVGRWLWVRLQLLGAGVVLFVCLFAVMGRETTSAGLVGLSITYALQITMCLERVVRCSSMFESSTVSLEKIEEYTETPTEAEWEIQETKPSADWPEKGCVEFQDYCVRYREDLDLVIKGITCKIEPNEKIGIVGRTGAGKSSLTMALFRILESARGKIIIDGIDISNIGLHDLRSKITIIPQDPVLFSGTMKINLDPFGEHSDEDLWRALEHAHLKTFVEGLENGLEHECSEGGENLSVGQRQLVCLARALLRKTKVLVLDEATAAVDLETDDLIQNTIRTEFADCTILTIAHRLNTIMDYTRVMVLDSGRIKEFDTPSNLLADSNGVFYSMAEDAGLMSKR